ncbi:alpha-amylase family glycosyl hydrolase [uncultured Helcococcus sp.]|uniref:alpha-amylase family glycosyl hydrolase n=1 Tax=uncultured Helcococcus sp. TaxID=1072508 RepID=UPI00288B0A90|nr:alpha-amylase family glycosyl hydrolase [uncultured Helcococcus sp.]
MKLIKKLSIFLLTILLIFNSGANVFAEKENKEIAWDEEIIYMVLTDRFYDGDESNNNPHNIDGSYDKDHLEAYHGGDFRGIIEKIDYLKELGITTLWITPIVKNIETNMMENDNGKQYGYHGYWAEDFTKLDSHLGNEEDLKELIDLLHENNIKLMVDVVLNHSGYGTKNQGDFAGMHREESASGDIESELAGLPDFKTEDKEVRDKIIKWQVDWLKKLKTDKGNSIDYFRVDTVKHVDHQTWIDFKSAVLEEDKDFKMIGENFGASVFNHGGYLSPEMMDSLLDFEFKDIAKNYVNGRIEDSEKSLIKRNQAISEEKQMGQFLSSHDEHGFLKMKLGGNVDKFLPAVSLQLTAKGQPVIYYGEEIGMSGQKDDFSKGIYSENRADFEWDKVKDNPILDHYKKLIAIRNAYADIFAKGDRKTIYADKKVSVFSRSYNGKDIYVALNTSDQDQELTFAIDDKDINLIDVYGNRKINKKDNKITVKIPANNKAGTMIMAADDDIAESLKTSDNSIIGQYKLYILITLGLLAVLIILFTKKNKKK